MSKVTVKFEAPEFIQAAIQDPSYKFLVAFSGGKDSVAMVLHLLNLGIAKDRICLHHHEVDGSGKNFFDWNCTTSYCNAFAEAFGIEIRYSYREGGIKREMYRNSEGLQDILFQTGAGSEYSRIKSKSPVIETEKDIEKNTKMKFPAIAASLSSRWCSAVVKIDVMAGVLANDPEYKEGNFIVCTGERREESANRSKYNELESHKRTTKKRFVHTWRPVIDFTEADVWNLYAENNVQPHPCYELGWSRCSCQLCIFGSADVWASILDISPEKIDQIESIENEFAFTMDHKKGIREKAEAGTSFVTAKQKRRWSVEALGTFTSPIFVEKFILPAGAFGEGNVCGAA